MLKNLKYLIPILLGVATVVSCTKCVECTKIRYVKECDTGGIITSIGTHDVDAFNAFGTNCQNNGGTITYSSITPQDARRFCSADKHDLESIQSVCEEKGYACKKK